MTEPRTAAGRALDQDMAYLLDYYPDDWVAQWRDGILAIEAEARAAALDEVRAAVAADKRVRTSDLFLVLAAINALREK